jgi:hypothetical protein
VTDLLDRVMPVTVEDDEWWGRAMAWIDALPDPAVCCIDFAHLIERAVKALAVEQEVPDDA